MTRASRLMRVMMTCTVLGIATPAFAENPVVKPAPDISKCPVLGAQARSVRRSRCLPEPRNMEIKTGGRTS